MKENIFDKKKIKIENIKLLFENKLIIPKYQRPYKWKEKHVTQLLNDIWDSMISQKETYRIGTVILHNENEKQNIVDGQQRLVTITLILLFLGENKLPLLNCYYTHIDSKDNIKYNYTIIKRWFSGININQQSKYKKYLNENCEFVKIELEDISEAFQLFDSQNARGKSLEPYDLLKAFHLREMDANTQDERKYCAEKWQKSVDDGLLNNLGKYIYRIRKWSKGEDAGYFSKEDIDEFKGMNLFKYKDYPYLKSSLLNDATITQVFNDPINRCFNEDINYPFQINQLIINGKRFFEYVDFYSKLFAKLFYGNGSQFYSFYQNYCYLYQGSNRTGDIYVREMFEASILLYFDKYGETNFEKISVMFYKWCYILRLKQTRVTYASVDKYIRDRNRDKLNIFKLITQTYHPKEILGKNNEILLNENEVNYRIEKVYQILNQELWNQ